MNLASRLRIWNPITKGFSWEAADLRDPYVQSYTTLAAADQAPIYEGDILSFTIKGITHGPEREGVAAAHVWWCAEDGCWAFGRWIQQTATARWGGTDRFYAWWYTMADRIDRATIKVLGNVYEHPALLPLLGYDPFAPIA